MTRIPLFPTTDPMTEEQNRVYEKILSGPRNVIVGPLRALLHSPELADRFQNLGAFLRFGTSLPAHLTELAILVIARHWNSQVEWHVHARAALEQGISSNVIDALKCGSPPDLPNPDESMVYEFTRQLQMSGQVSQKTYGRVKERFDVVGIVELTALIGYYTMVSMNLNAHQISLPDGAPPPLEPLASPVEDFTNTTDDRGLTAIPRLIE